MFLEHLDRSQLSTWPSYQDGPVYFWSELSAWMVLTAGLVVEEAERGMEIAVGLQLVG